MVYPKGRQMSEMAEDEYSANEPAKGGKGWLKVVVAVIIVLLVLVIGAFLLPRLGVSLPTGDAIASVSNDWQAVFLANGQVYFGKVKSVSDKTLVLEDIYYLQVVTKPLQTTQTGQATAADQQPQQELTLIKLGNEIHGPVDKMVMNRDQILLTEKLKKDSRVVQAIDSYLQQQKTDAAAKK